MAVFAALSTASLRQISHKSGQTNYFIYLLVRVQYKYLPTEAKQVICWYCSRSMKKFYWNTSIVLYSKIYKDIFLNAEMSEML